MTPAAVGNRDTTAAVFNGLGRIYMVPDPPTAAETGLEPPPQRGRRSGASWQGLSNPWVAIFTGKKAPAASWIAATGLVKSMGGHFHRKKSACDKLDSSNRACQIPGGHFHRKKAPAASWRAATGLVKSWVANFVEKKAPAASW